MKCGYAEELLGLYVEGDLPERETLQVENHLLACAACRDAADDLRESQSVFKSLRQEAVGASTLADLRQRVLDEVAAGKASRGLAMTVERALFAGFRRKYALTGLAMAGLVTALAIAGFWQFGRETNSRTVPLETAGVPAVPSAPSAPETSSVSAPPAIPEARPARPKRTKRLQQPAPIAVQPEPEPQQLVVKLFTDDPNVVIYWFVDKKGASE